MVNIDFRKLISFGKGSYIVSMPKEWVEKNNLKKGDVISVNNDGFELVLSASKQDEKQEAKETDIDAKGKDLEVLKTEIVTSYLNGYDTINIMFEHNSKEVTKIKDVIRNLSGMEIMEQTSTRIVAKNLINLNEISMSNIIRRMDIITRAMVEDCILCYKGQCTYDNIYHRDFDINRLYYLGYKFTKNAMKNPRLAKSLKMEPWQLHSDILAIKKMERIADRQKRISRFLCEASLDRGTIAELEKIHTDIGEAYNNAMKAYYSKDKQLALNVEFTNKDRTESCNRLLERYTKSYSSSKAKTNANLVAIAKIIENLKATSIEARDIARIVLCYE